MLALHQGIKDRREEIQGRVRATRWHPEGIARIELAEILDYFEEELNRLCAGLEQQTKRTRAKSPRERRLTMKCIAAMKKDDGVLCPCRFGTKLTGGR